VSYKLAKFANQFRLLWQRHCERFLRSNFLVKRQNLLSTLEIASSHTTLTCPARLSGVAMTTVVKLNRAAT
jgi:hypothetical protein